MNQNAITTSFTAFPPVHGVEQAPERGNPDEDFAACLGAAASPLSAQPMPVSGKNRAVMASRAVPLNPEVAALRHFDPTAAAVSELASAGAVRPTTAQAVGLQQAPPPEPQMIGDEGQGAEKATSSRVRPAAGRESALAPGFGVGDAGELPRLPIQEPPAEPSTRVGADKSSPKAPNDPAAPAGTQANTVAPQAQAPAQARSPLAALAARAVPAAIAAAAPVRAALPGQAEGLARNESRLAQLASAPRLSRSSTGEPVEAQFQRGLALALRQGGGTVTLHLQPESLGDLRVRMSLDEARVEASFEASNEQARRLLGDSLGSLRSALEARGLEVTGLNVTVGDPPDRGTVGGHFTTPGGAGESHGGAHGGAGREQPEGNAARQDAGSDRAAVVLSVQEAAGVSIETGGAQGMWLRLDAIA